MSRQKAYEIVQRNAMKVWKGGRATSLLAQGRLPTWPGPAAAELEAIFDYNYYLQHVDEIFQRLGLTKSQWQSTIRRTTNAGRRHKPVNREV
jgi:adenylosuccinate lyase